MSYIEFKNISKIYQTGSTCIKALDDASFKIDKGQLVIILGQSGAGKTTALNILGGMDRPTSGQLIVDGVRIDNLKEKDLIRYRRKDIGFVFQFYNLIPNLTALENVELAVQLVKEALNPKEVLSLVGLLNRQNNFPSQLSGGEQQRISIARALAKKPKVLLCDEPTGALDYETGKEILKLLQTMTKKYNMTVIIVTHNSAIAPMADKIIKFKNGKIESVVENEIKKPIEELEW